LFHEICQPKFCLDVALQGWISIGIVLISNTRCVETGEYLWYVSNPNTVALIIFQVGGVVIQTKWIIIEMCSIFRHWARRITRKMALVQLRRQSMPAVTCKKFCILLVE